MSSLHEEIIRKESEYIAKTFNRMPVVWKQGQGVYLLDSQGRKYLDFFAGHAVMSLGYGHPAQLQAMTSQLQQLVHTGNLFYTQPQVELAEALVQNTFGQKVFFSNTGAEITELAIKLSRKWAKRQRPGDDPFEIITLKESFHGRTLGALSATGQEKYHQGLAPLLPGFKHVAINNLKAAAAAITNKTCAIMLEPIQGEGGIHVCEATYLQELRALCDHERLLLILDEIQCGLGRSGFFNAYEYSGIIPDVLLLGKSLGGGLPISALVTRPEVADALKVGDHGTTFGGNPVAASGGLVLIRELRQPGFLEQVRRVGDYLGQKLQALAAEFPKLAKTSRGMGLIRGLELKIPGAGIVNQALEQGLVINCTAEKVLRFLPALTITEAEVDQAMAILASVLQRVDPTSRP